MKEALPKETTGISIDFSDYNVAAAPIDFTGGLGQDVISFGQDTISLG